MTKIVIPDAAFGGPQAPTEWDNLMDPARKALEALIAKGDEMADRIEELEDQLAKAIEALRITDSWLRELDMYANSDYHLAPSLQKVRDTLAELTGGKDENQKGDR